MRCVLNHCARDLHSATRDNLSFHHRSLSINYLMWKILNKFKWALNFYESNCVSYLKLRLIKCSEIACPLTESIYWKLKWHHQFGGLNDFVRVLIDLFKIVWRDWERCAMISVLELCRLQVDEFDLVKRFGSERLHWANNGYIQQKKPNNARKHKHWHDQEQAREREKKKWKKKIWNIVQIHLYELWIGANGIYKTLWFSVRCHAMIVRYTFVRTVESVFFSVLVFASRSFAVLLPPDIVVDCVFLLLFSSFRRVLHILTVIFGFFSFLFLQISVHH